MPLCHYAMLDTFDCHLYYYATEAIDTPRYQPIFIDAYRLPDWFTPPPFIDGFLTLMSRHASRLYIDYLIYRCFHFPLSPPLIHDIYLYPLLTCHYITLRHLLRAADAITFTPLLPTFIFIYHFVMMLMPWFYWFFAAAVIAFHYAWLIDISPLFRHDFSWCCCMPLMADSYDFCFQMLKLHYQPFIEFSWAAIIDRAVGFHYWWWYIILLFHYATTLLILLMLRYCHYYIIIYYIMLTLHYYYY